MGTGQTISKTAPTVSKLRTELGLYKREVRRRTATIALDAREVWVVQPPAGFSIELKGLLVAHRARPKYAQAGHPTSELIPSAPNGDIPLLLQRLVQEVAATIKGENRGRTVGPVGRGAPLKRPLKALQHVR